MSSTTNRERRVAGDSVKPEHPASLSLEVVEGKERLYLQGCISVNNVGDYRDQIISIFTGKPDLAELDLSRTELNGSSVVALLISIQRFIQTENRHLVIVQPQPKLLEMAAMNGLRDILPFEQI